MIRARIKFLCRGRLRGVVIRSDVSSLRSVITGDGVVCIVYRVVFCRRLIRIRIHSHGSYRRDIERCGLAIGSGTVILMGIILCADMWMVAPEIDIIMTEAHSTFFVYVHF